MSHILVLGRFRKISKGAIRLVMSVLSVRTEQLGTHSTDFHKILHLSIFRKYNEKIQVSLKSDNNNEYFT